MKFTLGVIGLVFLMGCANVHLMNRLNLGMTKADVVAQMGNPVNTRADKGAEYLIYRLYERDGDAAIGNTTDYFVRIIDGKVDAYGQLGDFGSTALPESKSTIDLNIKKTDDKN